MTKEIKKSQSKIKKKKKNEQKLNQLNCILNVPEILTLYNEMSCLL